MTTDDFAKAAYALLGEGIEHLRAHAGEGAAVNRYCAVVEGLMEQYQTGSMEAEPASTDEADGAVPAGYRLGDGWEVTRSGLLCWACKPTRRALYLLRDKNTWLVLRSSACGDCAVRLGALVPLSPPGDGAVPAGRKPVPPEVHERGWQWRPVGDGAFAPPFGTIRVCEGCGCLVAGGPTQCSRCALVSLSPPGDGAVPVCKAPDSHDFCSRECGCATTCAKRSA